MVQQLMQLMSSWYLLIFAWKKSQFDRKKIKKITKIYLFSTLLVIVCESVQKLVVSKAPDASSSYAERRFKKKFVVFHVEQLRMTHTSRKFEIAFC